MSLNRSPPVARFKTDGFACWSVKHSPFYPDRWAVASAQYFGLTGNGRLHALTTTAPFHASAPNATLSLLKSFDTQDGLYDLAWSEIHENQIATVSGDGSVKLWDMTLNDFPIQRWAEHSREVYSVDWNNLKKELFATASWDHTIKIWTPNRPKSITTIPAHQGCIYKALFSPQSPDTLASCSADGTLAVWDLNAPTPQAQLSIPAHPAEVLSLDWNKYQPFYIATSSVDRSIRIHDIRMASTQPQARPSALVTTLLGHEYAVRNVAFSPHNANLLASASYDMTARTWDVNLGANSSLSAPGLPATQGVGASLPRRIHDLHTEFVVGLSWSLFEPGVVASCSWDQQVHLWQA